MPKNIDASIIITTYSRPSFLKKAIDSCINQDTKYNYNIIVIDDNGKGSGFQKETEKLVEKYPDIVYFAHEYNQGACVARNKGIELSTADYIFFLDDDDVFLPNKVDIQLRFLERNPKLDGCLVGLRRIDYKNGKVIYSDSNHPRIGTFKDFVVNGNFFTPMLCIKRESVLNIGGFDVIPRFQDRYFMIKALLNNQSFEVLKNVESYILYEHTENRITTKSGIRKTIDSLNVIKNKILPYRNLFKDSDWSQYILNEYRIKGVTHYISLSYFERLTGGYYFFKALLISHDKKDLLSLIKCIFKII